MERLVSRTGRFGARNMAETMAVLQHDATRTALICHDRGRPCTAWATYRPNKRLVVSQLCQRVELRAKQYAARRMNGVVGITGRIAPTTARPKARKPAPRRAIRFVPVATGMRWSKVIIYPRTPGVPRRVPVHPAGKQRARRPSRAGGPPLPLSGEGLYSSGRVNVASAPGCMTGFSSASTISSSLGSSGPSMTTNPIRAST